MHWHIDYLLHYGQVICVHTYAGEKKAECVLSQKIGNIKNAMMLVSGFGSSDCSCTSHLYFFQDNPDSRLSRLKINGISSPPPLTPPTRGGGKTFPPPRWGRLDGGAELLRLMKHYLNSMEKTVWNRRYVKMRV
jgi:hypothetical protein